MFLSYSGLKSLLQQNIVEALFRRRHYKPGYGPNRRIWCTLDRNFLLSLNARLTFNFNPPTHPPPYNAQGYNLLVVWDLMWQDWRAIALDSIDVVSVIPCHTKKQQEEFWQYFNASIKDMTPSQKDQFSNK